MQEHSFSITPFAIAARKAPSDHSVMTELKETLTSEVSEFIENEKLKRKAFNIENTTQQNLLHEALTLYSEGLYDEAAKKLNTILSLGQSVGDVLSLNPGSMALMARAYANQGKLDEAKEWCMQAIKAEKLLPGHYYLHATICQEQGLLEESINSLKKALYLDQDFVLAHFALGNLTQKQGRLDESRKHFKNALSLLVSMNPEEVLPYSEGIQAGSLLEVIQSMIREEKAI
ncbi:MAG: tetratricopeptide repeat protein [bacterium]